MIDTPTRKVLEFSLTLTGPLGIGLQPVLDAAEAAGWTVTANDAKLQHAKPDLSGMPGMQSNATYNGHVLLTQEAEVGT